MVVATAVTTEVVSAVVAADRDAAKCWRFQG